MSEKSGLIPRLASLLPVLRDVAEELLKWEEERPGGGRRAEGYRIARDYYAKQAGLACRAADRVTGGCLVEVRVTPYDFEGKPEKTRTEFFFVGPLTNDDDFLRSMRWRESSLTLNGGGGLLNRRLGERWSESAHSRDENHTEYVHEIAAIASCVEAAF